MASEEITAGEGNTTVAGYTSRGCSQLAYVLLDGRGAISEDEQHVLILKVGQNLVKLVSPPKFPELSCIGFELVFGG